MEIEEAASFILKNGIPRFIEYEGPLHVNMFKSFYFDIVVKKELGPHQFSQKILITNSKGTHTEYDCFTLKVPFLHNNEAYVQFYNFIISGPLRTVESFEPIDMMEDGN